MSTDEERIYSIALTQIPGVGHIGAKRLVDGMGSATDVFRYRTELPDRLPGVNRAVVAALDSPQALKRAEQEYEFARNNRISCFTLADEDYPSRLRECDDAPVVLFFKGRPISMPYTLLIWWGPVMRQTTGSTFVSASCKSCRCCVRMCL